jgi:RND superfamily putative drug exporter
VRTAVEQSVDGQVLVTGAGRTVEDYFTAVYDAFPYVLALIALITFCSWCAPSGRYCCH